MKMKRKKKLKIWLLILIFSVTPLFPASANSIASQKKASPDDFILTSPSSKQQESNHNSSNYGYHDIPITVKSTGKSKYYRSTLPVSYSSVRENLITPVKNQNPYGTCWAFAAMSCAETSMLLHNKIQDFTPDYSELQHAYFTYNRVPDPLGGTQGDSVCVPQNDFLDAGGNSFFSAFTLANWIGAANEETLPYSSAGSLSSTPPANNKCYLDDTAHLQNSFWIPMSDISAIKRQIQNYGAVAASYYSDDNFYKYGEEHTSYYYPPSGMNTSSNHAVTLVGWDDTFSKNKFLSSNLPDHDGAWLVKNSWGTNWGENGYFWISYEDSVLSNGTGIVFDFESADTYDNNYQYDGTCSIASLSTQGGNSCYLANIFTASSFEDLKAVGFYTTDPGMKFKVKIYTGLTDSDIPISGNLVQEMSGQEEYEGYHTVSLPSSVRLKQGDQYSVVIYYENPYADSVSFFLDCSSDYGWISTTSKANPGESFCSLTGTYNSWGDCGEFYQGNVRIKAFTDHYAKVDSLPVPSALTYGQTLADSKLTGGSVSIDKQVIPGTFKWKSPDVKPSVADSNHTPYSILFVPSNNSCSTLEMELSLPVSKAQIPSNLPPAILRAACNASTIQNVPLSQYNGWKWKSSDLAKPLSVETTQTGTAEYILADKTNYEQTTTNITVTRNPHTWDQGTITQAASQTKTGLKTYTCTICHETKRETIPALPVLIPPKGSLLKNTKSIYKVTGNRTVSYYGSLSRKATSATIPSTVKLKGITYKVTSIYKNAFKNMKKLKKVTIGKNITVLGSSAFYNCSSLKKITIPANVKQINTKCFYGCKKLSSITIKTSRLTTKKVGNKAFGKIASKPQLRVPKKKIKTYQSIFRKKGLTKKAKFKKL